jgi:hypothetical protein
MPDVFLRPPRGIGLAPQSFNEFGVNYYRYARPNAAGSLITDVYIAFGGEAGPFVPSMFRHFGPKAEAAPRKKREVQRQGLDPLIFDSSEWDDENGSYSCNILRGPVPLAVIYRVEKFRLTEVATPLDLSLQSLVVGPEAEEARKAHEKQRTGQ